MDSGGPLHYPELDMEGNLIIDSHVHITPPDIIKNDTKFRAAEPYFNLLSSSPKNKYTTAEDLVAAMDSSGVDRSVVFGFGFTDMDLCRRVNDYTIESVRKFPDKLIGFATVNPLSPDAEKELHRCRTAGLQGVGELMPAGQGFDITETSHMQGICDFCSSHRWPLLIHINESVGHYYPGKTDVSPRDGAVLAGNFPDVTIIFAHMGGGLCFYETMPELKYTLSNVYYDTAALPFLYDRIIYDGIRALKLTGKILFGSDYPLLPASVYIEGMKKTSMEKEELETILGGNLSKILG